jgi:putative nucleotidyltransferase with HDIG domain
VRARRRFGIVGSFAVWSAVVVAAFTAGVTALATQQVAALSVESSARSLAAAVNGAIVHTLTSEQLADLKPSELRALDEVIKASTSSDVIRQVKIWSPSYEVVYSSFDPSEVGKVYPDYDNVKAALAGEVAFDVNTSDKDESEREAEAFGDVVEVYSPILDRPGGKVLGVFEVYQNYGPIRERMVQRLWVVWGLSLLAGVLLYLVQLTVVKRAADRLRETEDEVEEMNGRLESSMRDIEEHSIGTLQALIKAVDAKDSYTAHHSLGVTDLAAATGRRIGLSGDELRLLERAALLHDIGKIGVPEAVLLKPGALDAGEYLTVQEHSDMGARIIESIPFLKDLVPVVRYHHERWDGSGYPHFLSGERIPLLARVLAVADAFEAMTSDRPYRRAMDVPDAVAELRRNAGSQFDPRIVEALLAAVEAGEVRAEEAAQERPRGSRGAFGR